VKRVPVAFALAIAATGALVSQGAPAVQPAPRFSVDVLEQQLLSRVNTLRGRQGLTPLRVSAALSSAADQHTKDMARKGFCGHDSASGIPFGRRISRFYGHPPGWRAWSAAENVLCFPRRLTAAAALGEWLARSGHRANLLSGQWREVGLAALYVDSAPGEFAGDDVLLVTANFGVRY
jgi:uncharacterized protein YkwD